MVSLRRREICTVEETRCSTQARQNVVALFVETLKHRRCRMPGRMQQQRFVTPLMLTRQEVRLPPLGPMRQGIGQNSTDMFHVHVRAPTPPGERLRIAIDRAWQAVGGT